MSSEIKIADLVKASGGVPSGGTSFDAALMELTNGTPTWKFAKELRDAVASSPTDRGWSISGYALANSGFLKDAIHALEKGRQSNTSYEVKAACYFVLDKPGDGVQESKRSSDSAMHVVQAEAGRDGHHGVHPHVWTMSVVYILGRPPVFGGAPESDCFGLLDSMNLALKTVNSAQGVSANPGHPIFEVMHRQHLDAWRSRGVEASKPGVLLHLMGEWQASFREAARKRPVHSVLQDLVAHGKL